LTVAFDHDEGQERANNSTSDQDENNRETDCPDTRREERLRGVRRIDEWLYEEGVRSWEKVEAGEERRCTISSVQMV
jgi:hypothetical protein